MRASTLRLIQAALLLSATGSLALPPTPSDHLSTADIEAISAEKLAADRGGGVPNPIYVNVGGDTIATATVIPNIPYADSGNTCQFTHNYDEDCPYNLPGAPDVVYRYNAASSTILSFSLCNSAYDTKIYVYENAVGNLIGCSDDDCGSDGFKSDLQSLTLSAGNTYYIVIDGWSSTDCGNYEFVANECFRCGGCAKICPPGGTLEDEPNCHDDYVDTYNGGCDSNPPVFSPIPCNSTGAPVTMCGTFGGFTYFGQSYRDTDWYSTTLIQTSSISWCVEGQYDMLIGIIDGNAGCPVASFYDYAFGSPCETVCLDQTLPPGEWWFFVATSGFGSTAGPCGGKYNATLTGAIMDCPVSVESASWGQIKGIYR